MANRAANPVLSVEEWDARIGGLLAQHEAEEAELRSLVAERAGIALAVTSGDPEAQARLAVINARTMELTASMDMLRMAVDGAGEARRKAAGLVEQRAEETRHRDILTAAAELLDASRRADKAMAALAEALGRRKAAAMRLHGLGHRASRFLLPDQANRAAQAHGLVGLLTIPRGAPQHCKPLAEADAPLLPLSADQENAA